MKKNSFRTFLMLAAALFAVSQYSCKDPKEGPGLDPKASISVAPTTFSAAADGDATTLQVTASSSWRILILDADNKAIDWITVDISSGSANEPVAVTVKKNPDTEIRTGYITASLLDGSASDKMTVTQAAGEEDPERIYFIKPIVDIINADLTTFEQTSSTLNTTTRIMTFTESGNTIEKLGGGTVKYQAFGNNVNNVIHAQILGTGWADWQNVGWLITINNDKPGQILKGKLRLGFAMRSPNGTDQSIPVNWKAQWSADKTTWNPMTAGNPSPNIAPEHFGESFTVSTGAIYKMGYFEIPEDKAIPAGSKIYFKISPLDGTPLKGETLNDAHEFSYYYGFYLSTHEPGTYNTSELPTDEDIVFAWGFDDCFWSHNYFIGSKQFNSIFGRPYVPAVDESELGNWDLGTYLREGLGYLGFGTGATATTTTYLGIPKLTALGDTPTNVTVSFRAAFYLSPLNTADNKGFTVSISEGPGTVVGTGIIDTDDIPTSGILSEMEATYFKWRDYSVKITGATKDTKIRFTTHNGGRNFLDDIVVKKD